MADDLSPVEAELNEHKSDITGMMNEIGALDVPCSQKEVVSRFVNDCKTTIGYIDSATEPSSDDLCDFVDRKNSLDVQYHNIKESVA